VQEPLAEGEFFELTRAVDDETRVRAAAQAALDRAGAPGSSLVETAQREDTVAIRLASFEALRRLMTGVDPDRASAIEAREPTLREAFGRLGHSSGDLRVFEQPVRVRVLAAR
jgi:hypothetical protein